ncbi:MAG: OmpH family outer membrane protein [Paludibacter sp.]|nr:OmpH family outer membrane protein [Paludibacter sp.]
MKKLMLLLLIMVSTNVFGQKMTYVYTDSILLSIPEYVKKATTLDSLKQSYQKELEQTKAVLQDYYNKLVIVYKPTEKETLAQLKKRMTPVDTVSLAKLQEENIMLQTKTKDVEARINARYAQDIQPVLDKVKKVLSGYAVKNNIPVIYSMEQITPTLVYIDKRNDITKAIIDLLKK